MHFFLGAFRVNLLLLDWSISDFAEYNSGNQGSHMLEKYLNIEGFLEKSLKTKYALKSTLESLQGLEKSLNFIIFCRTTLNGGLDLYKFGVPLFGAAYAAPNRSTTILY